MLNIDTVLESLAIGQSIRVTTTVRGNIRESKIERDKEGNLAVYQNKNGMRVLDKKASASECIKAADYIEITRGVRICVSHKKT